MTLQKLGNDQRDLENTKAWLKLFSNIHFKMTLHHENQKIYRSIPWS